MQYDIREIRRLRKRVLKLRRKSRKMPPTEKLQNRSSIIKLNYLIGIRVNQYIKTQEILIKIYKNQIER